MSEAELIQLEPYVSIQIYDHRYEEPMSLREYLEKREK